VSGRRYVEDATLVSTDGPPLRMRVDPSLRYLGSTELVIKDLALAERHYFVDARANRVRRMLVAQFEGFLSSNDERYVYRLPDPVSLGGETYGTWVFADRLSAAPGGDAIPESVDTRRMLDEHALTIDDELLIARFARIVGDDGRREVLVFYTEPLRALGHSFDTIADEEGDLRPPFAAVGQDLVARARRAFEIVGAPPRRTRRRPE
jgi:hypothetical protein